MKVVATYSIKGGVGKTTLARMLLGLLTPTSGRITLDSAMRATFRPISSPASLEKR